MKTALSKRYTLECVFEKRRFGEPKRRLSVGANQKRIKSYAYKNISGYGGLWWHMDVFKYSVPLGEWNSPEKVIHNWGRLFHFPKTFSFFIYVQKRIEVIAVWQTDKKNRSGKLAHNFSTFFMFPETFFRKSLAESNGVTNFSQKNWQFELLNDKLFDGTDRIARLPLYTVKSLK